MPGRPHPALLRQLLDLGDVDGAPVAALAARRESLGEALGVDRVADAVDPADAERLVDRLGPGQLGSPVALRYWPSHSSAAVSWFASNQSRSSAGLSK